MYSNFEPATFEPVAKKLFVLLPVNSVSKIPAKNYYHFTPVNSSNHFAYHISGFSWLADARQLH